MKTNIINLKKPRLEYFGNINDATDRYNELLYDPHIYSIFIDPVKDKKGYWIIEIVEYVEKQFKIYGN